MPVLKRKPFVPRKRKATKAPLTSDDVDTLKSALLVFILSLQPGSDVDVFVAEENLFYEATVKSVSGGGFRYTFKNRRMEQGFVYFNDCLGTWRPPMTRKHLTPDTLLLIYDAMNPAQ